MAAKKRCIVRNSSSGGLFMILTVDIGNTNIVLGGWENRKLRFSARLETNKTKTTDGYAIELMNVLTLYEIPRNFISGSIISSVVPQITEAVSVAVERLTGKKPLVVGPGIKTGLNIRIDNPAQLGSDLVVDAVAALAKYKPPIIIFDMGTATTVSVIEKDGSYAGGAILPGIRVATDALSQSAAQLPQIDLDAPRSIIAKNTVDCMKSGAIFGTASMIDGMVKRIEEQLGCAAETIATGGNSRAIVPYCKCGITYDGNLLIEGLLNIYYKNAQIKV